VADLLPIIRLDVGKHRIHGLDAIATDESADLLELLGSHQHLTGIGRGINDVHRCPATFLDGPPELIGEIGRHGKLLGGKWINPVYPHRSKTPSKTEREPAIGEAIIASADTGGGNRTWTGVPAQRIFAPITVDIIAYDELTAVPACHVVIDRIGGIRSRRAMPLTRTDSARDRE
jgi:hypothetical protein